MKRKSKSYNSKAFLTLLAFLFLLFTSITPLFAQDTDGDGLIDNTDLDDDNDGILDTNEGCVATETGGNSVLEFGSVNSETGILSTTTGSAVFNNTADGLVINFGVTLPTGTTISILTDPTNSSTKIILVEESDSTGSTTNGGITITRTDAAAQLDSFLTIAPTQYIKITILDAGNGNTNIDYVSYRGQTCSLDTDGDGITNNLDLDSDADGCPDALEGGNSLSYTKLVASSVPGGSTSIQDNLGNVVDSDGVPFSASGGQTIGSSLDSLTEATQCVDSDGDSVKDYKDLDDDNDGILDSTEGTNSLEFNFDTTNESWVEDNVNNGTLGNLLSHSSTGMAEGGSSNFCPLPATLISTAPYGNFVAALDYQAGVMYFESPTFTAVDMSTSINKGQLSFFWANGYMGSGSYTQSINTLEVILTDGTTSITANFDVTGEADGTWRNKTFSLDDATWSGNLTDLTNVLSALNRISINVETISGAIASDCSGTEFFAIDEVIFTPWEIDTDGDGITNNLDLDSDADGCPDALEGANNLAYTNLYPSTMPGGSTSIQDHLGNVVDANGVPTVVSGGQAIGSSINNATEGPGCTDTDSDTVRDYLDVDDDNDGILDTIENGSNLLIDGGFDSLSPPLFGNNIGNVSIAPWVRESGGTANVILVDGAGGSTYGAGGPEFDASGGAGNYFDVYGSGVIYQTFTLATNTIVSYGGYFSARDGLTGNGSIAIYSGTGSGGTLMGSSGTITTSDNTDWTFTTNTLALIAGTYSFVVTLDNPINFDQGFVYNVDVDGDGIINALDLDSDGDGCPDAIESATSTALLTSGVSATDGITDNTDNALVNTTVDPIGANGFANSLEDVDTSGAVSINAYTATNYTTYALDAATNGCGVPVITQVYRNGTERWIELTNESTSNVLVPNGANLNLFSGGTTTARTATGANTAVLAPGESLLFESGATPTITPLSGVTRIVDAGLTNISNTSDIVSISRSGLASSTLPWDSRIDVITGIDNNTALVRTDEILAPNTTFTGTEWVTFVDDALSPYANPPQRHPHAPLISEIAAASSQSNITLGRHRFGPTNRTGSVWDNGDPDRTREVIIDEDYSFSTDLKARNLVVDNNSIVSANGSLLVVSDGITLSNANDEIRLRGASQLIQTHTGTTQISGDGKLLKDQNSPTPSTYRYNYFSSPVHTIGGTDYNVASVLKDGTSALSSAGVIGTNIAKDISFVTGLDGNTTDPIEIAERWLYTYPSAVNSYWSWNKISSTDAIPQTDGFIMKGPGRAQNYTFMGTPKDGELTTNIGANEFYLVGNPFPSALSAERFIRDNLGSITGDLLFWQHNGELANSGEFGHYYDGYIGGYAVRNLSMGIKADGTTGIGAQGTAGPISGTFLAPEPYIPVGQGFVIIGNGTGGPIVFNNSQREFIGEGAEGSNTSIFFKNNSKTPHAKNTSNESGKLPIIKLGIDYKNQDDLLLHRQIGISFSSENSFSYEKGYDSEIYQLGFTDIYWKFPNDDKNYVITGVQELTDNMEVPLEITMGADGELTMGIDQIINIDKPTYIKDAFLNKTYLINKETRETISLPKGTYTNRFYLVFTDSSNAQGITLSTEENQELIKDIQVRVDKKTNDILIENNSDAYIEKVTMYNILGQVIKQWDTLEQGEKHRLKVKNTTNQVYIITIQTNKGSFSKKIINHGKKVVLHNTKELLEENTKITNPEYEQKPKTAVTSTIQNVLD